MQCFAHYRTAALPLSLVLVARGSPKKMEIRKAQKQDSVLIQSLLEQLGYSNSKQSIVEAIDASHHHSEIFVALEQNKVIAFISTIYFYYFPSNCNVCRITGIAVDSSMRGNGVGTELINFAKQIGLNNGCEQLEITTSIIREKTQKYSEYLGFQKASVRYFQTIGN